MEKNKGGAAHREGEAGGREIESSGRPLGEGDHWTKAGAGGAHGSLAGLCGKSISSRGINKPEAQRRNHTHQAREVKGKG